MNKPCKVLCLFDYNCFTGFGTVSHNIKREIRNYFGNDLLLDICAINYFGEPYQEDNGATNVFSALNSATKKDPYGRFAFLKKLHDTPDYDGIFILQDIAVVHQMIQLLRFSKDHKKKNKQRDFKSIFYFPIDSKLDKRLFADLQFFDCLVTYTEYGRNEILRHRPDLKGKVKVLPHGNNSNHFYPIPQEDRLKFRKEYFGSNSDKFIITNVNRNQPRKDIPTTIFAFIEAKNRWREEGLTSEPFLYLHMNADDPMGWKLNHLFSQTDLIENVDYKILEPDMANNGASIKTLNNIYNASDVYITTTHGEGWGLTLTEAMATKTPIICPLSTSFIEMTDNGKRAYVIENLIPTCSIVDNVVREQCDIYEVADTILHVASGMQGLLEDMNFTENHNKRVNSAYDYINSLSWKEICKSWIQYFKETY